MAIKFDLQRILVWISGVAAVYQLLVASRLLTVFGIFVPAPQHRAISLLFALTLIYFGRSISGSKRSGHLAWYDALLLALGLVGVGYVALDYDAMLNYSLYGYLDTLGITLALLAAVAILEAARRMTGWVLPALIVAFLLAARYQNYLPGLLHGKGFALDRLTYSIYVGSAGIFGIPLGVAVTILITFIIFGRLLEESGAGQWFIRLAMCLTGWTIGGPAKAAVMASGFFGMISGSPAANVATTGAITIPLMKRIGYPARFAGAVEAVASTGGQFMPPVMGAVAFIMAEWLGIPYVRVVGMAFLPAILYFVVLFMSVHFEAGKRGLEAVARQDLPPIWGVLREGWFYAIPIAVLLYFLLGLRYPPEMAALLSSFVLIAMSFLARDKALHLTPGRIWQAMAGGVQNWLTVAAVTAAVGMLIGSLELSGLAIKFSAFMVELSRGNLLATLVLVGLASFVLGMGLDSIPAYFTLTVLAAPALVQLGVPAEVAHLFVLYWGMASFITPPTCIAVYVACGISESKVWETGWEAVRLGLAVYLVPFAFVYNQALLARGSLPEVLLASGTALAGAILLAAGARGYAWRVLGLAQRLLVAAGGLFLIAPGVWTILVGLALGALGLSGYFPGPKKSVAKTGP